MSDSSTGSSGTGKWQQRLEQVRKEKQANGQAPTPASRSGSKKSHATDEERAAAQLLGETFGDVVPDLSDGTASDAAQRDLDAVLDKAIARIDVISGYNRWIGKKPAPSPLKGQRESIMCRCPIPGHNDSNPSAWMNIDKNTWYCIACERGGDTMDLAAFHYGVDGSYKDGKNFHDLRRSIGKEMGWDFIRTSDGKYVAIPPETVKPKSGGRFLQRMKGEPVEPPKPTGTDGPAPEKKPELKSVPEEPEPEVSNVVQISDAPSRSSTGDVMPDMDWRKVFTEDSFVKTFMDEVTQDDVPEMYHMAHALIALGMAMGRNVTLRDQPRVYSNLFLCILGDTSEGKSKSRRYMEEVIMEALPYDKDAMVPDGAKFVKAPSSGEGFVEVFRRMLPDPRNPKWHIEAGDVRAVVDYGELGFITGVAARKGNNLKYTFLDFYDCTAQVGYTTKGSGEVIARNPFCSVLTTVQPELIGKLLDEGDNAGGFLNRWNFFTGTSKEKKALFGFDIDLDESIEKLKSIHNWAKITRSLDWSEDAVIRFTQFFGNVIQPTRKLDNSAILGRADLTMKKFILLMAANNEAALVTTKEVEQAIAFWPYLLSCYRLVDRRVGVPKTTDLEEKIIAMCKMHKEKTGDNMAVGLMKNRLRKFSTEEILKALNNLEKIGELRRHEPKATGRGRPTEKWEAV